jgi:hypothetical protein
MTLKQELGFFPNWHMEGLDVIGCTKEAPVPRAKCDQEFFSHAGGGAVAVYTSMTATFARNQGTLTQMTKQEILRNQSLWANYSCPSFFDGVTDNFRIADHQLVNYQHLVFHRKLGYLPFLDEGYNGLSEKYVRVIARSHRAVSDYLIQTTSPTRVINRSGRGWPRRPS